MRRQSPSSRCVALQASCWHTRFYCAALGSWFGLCGRRAGSNWCSPGRAGLAGQALRSSGHSVASVRKMCKKTSRLGPTAGGAGCRPEVGGGAGAAAGGAQRRAGWEGGLGGAGWAGGAQPCSRLLQKTGGVHGPAAVHMLRDGLGLALLTKLCKFCSLDWACWAAGGGAGQAALGSQGRGGC